MTDRIEADRRAILGAVAGVAGLAYAGPVLAQTAAAEPQPRQAWATKDGAVKIGPNAAPVTSALDMLLIQQAFARYGMAYDEGLSPVLATLFTQDAAVEVAEGSARPFQKVEGLKAILANFSNTFGQQADQRRHCFSNIIVEEATETTARALAYALVSVASHGGLIISVAVIYTANLRKEGGLWKFSRLFIGMDVYTLPKPKV